MTATLQHSFITLIGNFSYLHDVHHYSPTENGILSALPTACLWISKIGSSYLNTWMQEKTSWKISTISKVLNGVGSVGLALFMVAATFLDATCAYLAVVFLCFSMLFTGFRFTVIKLISIFRV